MGHGVRSALVTAMVRALVEELRPMAADPGQLLTRINRDIRAILQQTGTPLFTTAFYLVADLETRRITYANAGHPRPFLIHRGRGDVEVLKYDDGKARPALGLFEDTTYPAASRPLAGGDLVMLFTDGLYEVESARHEAFSQELLLQFVSRHARLHCEELFNELFKEIPAFAEGHEFTDDVLPGRHGSVRKVLDLKNLKDLELRAGAPFPGPSELSGAEELHLVGNIAVGDGLDRRGQGEVGDRGPVGRPREVGGGHDRIVETGVAVELQDRGGAVGEGGLQHRLIGNQRHPAG